MEHVLPLPGTTNLPNSFGRMHAFAIVSGTDRKQRVASSFPTALLATVFYAHVSAVSCSNQELVEGIE
ncbi:uncharacterized protein Nmag_1627 [Natrialba magadii ATCC 43099]|uniref:Uncharacterized protein n=2 Tax=Natrialba magadii (strain ATCC 43099 / DSM 3394 / CCM 3739 / CIP 104546 / IAM 13178 / JCM 8861 / NBRC 102185 / NCIMB 2190 / MS3) TaxID=547559 RepID=D3SUE5_NATMM|nr:uncharacterized protein Nmag_1627 [Natrialba magadii ATCC 43099]